MNRPMLEQIVSSVLFEDNYPDRSSARERRRWPFASLLPRSCCVSRDEAESWTIRTECLVRGSADTTLQVEARFLQLLERKIGVIDPPSREPVDLDDAPPRYVDEYDCGGTLLQARQETVVRDRKMAIAFEAPARGEVQIEVSDFEFPAHRRRESVADASGAIGAVIVREQQTIAGSMEVGVARVADGLFKVRVQIENRSPLEESGRDVTLAALVSTHAILNVEHGEFLSMTDPPADCRGLAANMHNVGCWPVLVGDEGECDTMLASPIVLHDYPHVAIEDEWASLGS